MRTVEISAELDAAPEEILEELSPESILEYERTYEVEDVVPTDHGWLVTATSAEPDFEMKLAFEKRSDGYTYELIEGGPFEELFTEVTVHPDVDEPSATADEATAADGTDEASATPVRVTMISEFTFGGWLSPIVDWFAANERKSELERALLALASELEALDSLAGPHSEEIR